MALPFSQLNLVRYCTDIDVILLRHYPHRKISISISVKLDSSSLADQKVHNKRKFSSQLLTTKFGNRRLLALMEQPVCHLCWCWLVIKLPNFGGRGTCLFLYLLKVPIVYCLDGIYRSLAFLRIPCGISIGLVSGRVISGPVINVQNLY